MKIAASINRRHQNGQTLIETMVAIFILVMGVTAALGLALYAFGTSTNITKQIIATGLAREGVEAVKNMRDTNWLADTLVTNGCYDYVTSSNAKADCYRNWLTQQNYPSGCPFLGFNCYIKPPSNSTDYNYVLGFTTNNLNSNYWIFYQNPSLLCGSFGNTPRYGLDFSSDPAANSFFYGMGYYRPSCTASGSSEYYRKIVLNADPTAPFNKDVGPNLIVKAQVWWTDKKCPRVSDWPGPGKCSIELQTYLANWKNY